MRNRKSRDSAAWERAALITDGDTLDRPIAPAQLIVPTNMEIRGDLLIWRQQDSDLRAVWPGETLLTDFLKLAEAPDQAILNYARRWGVLRLCKHGLPASHNQPSGFDLNEPAGCRAVLSPANEGWEEPLAAWRRFAGLAHALVNIAAQLHCDKPGQDKDWQVVYESLGVEQQARKNRDRKQQAHALGQVVNWWLYLGGVKPRFAWRSTPAVTLGGHWLFGQLATQLTLAVSRTGGLYICAACGNFYPYHRRKNPNRDTYCPDCGRLEAQKAAARRYYHNKGRALYEEKRRGEAKSDAQTDAQAD